MLRILISFEYVYIQYILTLNILNIFTLIDSAYIHLKTLVLHILLPRSPETFPNFIQLNYSSPKIQNTTQRSHGKKSVRPQVKNKGSRVYPLLLPAGQSLPRWEYGIGP